LSLIYETIMSEFDFKPSLGLRNGHVQSLLSSGQSRRRHVLRQATDVLSAAREIILDGGADEEVEAHKVAETSRVQLQAFWSEQPPQQDDKPRQVAVLFHGWEGSAESNYVLGNAARLWREGFDVLRFNFRDHGETHGLNPGMFHSCRLDEVVHALKDWQERLGISQWKLCGYSLGGNFALRVGIRAPQAGLNLSKVVAVCPVINPANAMRAMDESGWFYQRHFERKWGRSIIRKKQLFPELYGNDDMEKIRGLNARTDYIARNYSGYKSAEHYYNGYSIGDGRLEALTIPATILTSEDDPVIPVWDFDQLKEMSHLDLHITRHGGHCGFLKNWRMESAAEDFIANAFQSAPGSP